MIERTFVLIKPDGVRRGLSGEIIRRFEMSGLQVVALDMAHPSHEEIDAHYPHSREWINRLGEKAVAGCVAVGKDPVAVLGSNDTMVIGTNVRKWIIAYMVSAPLIKLVLSGEDAIARVRELVGPTMPADAPQGTIRGDFSNDSAVVANGEGRVVHNLVHASENADEAAHEIAHWFDAEHICSYERIDSVESNTL